MGTEGLALPDGASRRDFVEFARHALLELSDRSATAKVDARRDALIEDIRRRAPSFEPRPLTAFEAIGGFTTIVSLALGLGLAYFALQSRYVFIAYGPVLWGIRTGLAGRRDPERESVAFAVDLAELEARFVAQRSIVEEDVDEPSEGESPVRTTTTLVQALGKKRLVRAPRGAALPYEGVLALHASGERKVPVRLLLREAGEDRPFRAVLLRAQRTLTNDEVISARFVIHEDGRLTVDHAVAHAGAVPLEARFVDEEGVDDPKQLAMVPVGLATYRR